MLGALLFAPVLDAQDLVATPYDKTGIYRKGDIVGWAVAVATGQPASPAAYLYKVIRNGAVQIGAGTLDLASGAEDRNEAGRVRGW